MSNIPLARELVAKALTLVPDGSEAADLLRAALPRMVRRPPAKPRAAPHSRPVTAKMAVKIRRYFLAHPDKDVQTYAQQNGFNSGRVSEAIQHDR